jgi:hypothetical protein
VKRLPSRGDATHANSVARVYVERRRLRVMENTILVIGDDLLASTMGTPATADAR